MAIDWADKIRKLLAMAEGGANEEERAAHLERAQALMIEHTISDAMLRAAGEKIVGAVGVEVWFKEDRTTLLIKAKRELLAGLADIHRCKVIVHGRNGRDSMSLVGFFVDRGNVNMMFNSIMLQLQTDMDRSYSPVYGPKRGWRVSFSHGYVRRVVARLRDAQRRQMANATSSTPGSALVLRDQSALVMDKFNEMFPKQTKVNMATSADSNRHGFAAGVDAGNRADLGGSRVGATHRKMI